MKNIEIYTDGACSGNPGPGGWGAVLKYGNAEKELSGSEKETTNNRMELNPLHRLKICLWRDKQALGIFMARKQLAQSR